MKKKHTIIITDFTAKEEILNAFSKLEIKDFKVHESRIIPEITVFCGDKKWKLLKSVLDRQKVYM